MKACQLCRFMFFCWILQSTHFMATTKAQGFLDQFRDRVEGEIRQALGSERNQPGQQTGPRIQSNSVPWEGGNQNNPGGNFRDSGGFIPPTSRPPSNTTNPRTTPQMGGGAQRIPAQGNSITGSAYREVPIRQTATNGQLIKLKLPIGMPQPVQYQLILGTRSYDYQMHPGESQTFNETTQWLIRYRNEGSETTYRLRGGKNYEFEVDSRGTIGLFEARPDEFPEPPKR